jgi:hypothetical protein
VMIETPDQLEAHLARACSRKRRAAGMPVS